MASSSVSNQALATTGSLLSIDVRMPLRKVFVKEVVPTYEAESKKRWFAQKSKNYSKIAIHLSKIYQRNENFLLIFNKP